MKPPLFKDLSFPLLPFFVLAMSFVVLLSTLAPYMPRAEDTPILQRKIPTLIPSPDLPSQGQGTFCGGIANFKCPRGYNCVLDGSHPDAGGVCQPLTGLQEFTCPASEWVDCMPGPDKPSNPQCQPDYLQWARANCPGFQGAAL